MELSWYARAHMAHKAQNLSHMILSEKVCYVIFVCFIEAEFRVAQASLELQSKMTLNF